MTRVECEIFFFIHSVKLPNLTFINWIHFGSFWAVEIECEFGQIVDDSNDSEFVWCMIAGGDLILCEFITRNSAS